MWSDISFVTVYEVQERQDKGACISDDMDTNFSQSNRNENSIILLTKINKSLFLESYWFPPNELYAVIASPQSKES